MTSAETQPIPKNELERLISLSELDLDYSSLSENFKDLTHLAAKVAGTEISLINLIDSYTQWTIAKHGIDVEQTPREESACQYTIMEDTQFEVSDLSSDERFKGKSYVKAPLSLRYYFGVPLKDAKGHNIGALCVLDPKQKDLSPEKTELLKIIAGEVMNRINTYHAIHQLQDQLKDAKETKKKVAHDIRGPLAGIIGLSNLIAQQGRNSELDEVLDFIKLIHKSSQSLLELADEILTQEQSANKQSEPETDLYHFKNKLYDLYLPQAKNKNIHLNIQISKASQNIPFSRNKLLQIAGNLISNAIKFTPENGNVEVDLELAYKGQNLELHITVTDTGHGLSEEAIQQISKGNSSSTKGTTGEKGYGFGLSLVKHLVSNLGGTMQISNHMPTGAIFQLRLPIGTMPSL